MDIIKVEKLVCMAEYAGSQSRSLDEVSFSVTAGELFCVLGAAGAGKTSLVRAISGLLPVSAGEIYVSGIDCRDENQIREVRKRCGVVFEHAEDLYISNSVETEVAFALRNFRPDEADIEKRMTEALTAVGLEGYENRALPLLSPFERYCVEIAAVLAYDPEIIIFDLLPETFDEAEISRVFNIIGELQKKGKTVLYTARNAQHAVLAQRVMLLKSGRVLACDSPRKILSNAGLLNEADIDLPFTVRVYHDLLEAGAKLDICPLDIDELVDEVCK